MKRLFIIASIFALCYINLNSNAQSGKSETITIKTQIYCDHCLECESCGGKLQKDFSFDKGILLVKVDDKAMTITVKYNPKKTNLDEIRRKISMYGYDADHIKADSLAVTKLDECCLKK